ncbi:microsomal glutathione s-transferase [Chrysochromulina tobinii]|uniref:Microsomal glutathione s-transferase n=1 Tax=Chrysochromulina tobinii TaxID=1460289 RepID=A0A0M0J6G1_9EUKA|nr:microsomal glutathione s-transferase [Chrysochromulina tobinii]|eukprot:KOO21818.1 microsomal glutathione s-transferase [Chrysochromulina sp. CCMP291]
MGFSVESLAVAKAQPAWVRQVDELLSAFCRGDARRESLPAMTKQQRGVVHEMAKAYNISTQSYDNEPRRHVDLFRTPTTLLSAGRVAESLITQATSGAPHASGPSGAAAGYGFGGGLAEYCIDLVDVQCSQAAMATTLRALSGDYSVRLGPPPPDGSAPKASVPLPPAILEVAALGFTPDQAAFALQSTGGHVAQAIELLIAQGGADSQGWRELPNKGGSGGAAEERRRAEPHSGGETRASVEGRSGAGARDGATELDPPVPSPLSNKKREQPAAAESASAAAADGSNTSLDRALGGAPTDHTLVTELQALGYPLLACRTAARVVTSEHKDAGRAAWLEAGKAWLQDKVDKGELKAPMPKTAPVPAPAPPAPTAAEARKKNDVQYPNLYATPGYHKEADAFNRVQRGHQNMFESLSSMQTMSLLGGLKHPKVAAVGFCLYLAGCYFYMVGYSDMSLDVKTARYKRGGGLKWLGILACMYTSTSLAGSMLRWW